MAKQTILLPALAALCLAGNAAAQGFGKAGEPVIRSEYRPKGDMYRDGWIDFNKNGKKDIFEDPAQPVDKRVEDLLSQMNLDEKTAQMATLYGYGRVLTDRLPTPEWKTDRIWKDGIGAIDEHLNGYPRGGRNSPDKNPWVWPASNHAWALNEVQRFFVENTRLGIPVDFTNEGLRGVESYRATNFPTQLGVGHTWNRDLVYKMGEIEGREAKALGYTNIYAPILDVGRDSAGAVTRRCTANRPIWWPSWGYRWCAAFRTRAWRPLPNTSWDTATAKARAKAWRGTIRKCRCARWSRSTSILSDG